MDRFRHQLFLPANLKHSTVAALLRESGNRGFLRFPSFPQQLSSQRAIGLPAGQHGPGDSHQLVGHSHHRQVGWLSVFQLIHPTTEGVLASVQPREHAAGAFDEQGAQVAIARLLMPNSVGFPPDECCRGTSPSHAAISRPLRNPLPLPTAAVSAVEMMGPIPGISSRRRQPSSSRADLPISLVTSTSLPSSCCSSSRSSLSSRRELGVKPLPASSKIAGRFLRRCSAPVRIGMPRSTERRESD